jgi:hypothetical protein
LNPKKIKHQETPVANSSTEELWKGESSARGSWQEKDAGWEERHPDWEQDEDAGQGAWQQGAWQQKEDDYDQGSDLLLEQDYRFDLAHDCLNACQRLVGGAQACLDAYGAQKESDEAEYDAQKDNEDRTEIQGGADQLGGFGNAWHANCQLQPELSVPVPHPIGRHKPRGTGAASLRRAHRAFAVAAGTTNPHKEGLKCAERQLRQCQSRAKSNEICFAAKNKVRNSHYKVGLWDHQRYNILTDFANQSMLAAAEEYATLKFSEGPG